MWPGPLPLCGCAFLKIPQDSSRFLKIPLLDLYADHSGRLGPPGPPCFLFANVFCFFFLPVPFQSPGLPLNERSKTLRPAKRVLNYLRCTREIGLRWMVGADLQLRGMSD